MEMSEGMRFRPQIRQQFSSKMKRKNHAMASSLPEKKCYYYFLLGLLGMLFVATIAAISLSIYSKGDVKFGENSETNSYFKALVERINAAEGIRWTAKFNPFATRPKDYNRITEKNSTAIEEYTDYLKEFFNSNAMKLHISKLMDFPSEMLPKNFDARLHWPNCSSISNVPNQGSCGSCYAVAAAGVASDRACISSNGSLQILFSEEDILGCCEICGNCYGGDPLKAMVYWVRNGFTTGGRDGCRPYSFALDCGTPCSPAVYPISEEKRRCERKCQNNYYHNNYNDDKHYASLAYSMYPRTMSLDTEGKNRFRVPTIIGFINETSAKPLSSDEICHIIMKELYLFGPTTMAFPVTEEFLLYSQGIFSPYPQENLKERIIYWHVVRLIGWGRDENNNHHWLAINSFGKYWGDYGSFRIDTTLLEAFGLEYETGLP